MSLATSNRDGGRTSESGHLRALYKAFPNGGVFQGLNATQRGAGANMSVDVQIGDALIPRSDATYAHPAWADAIYNQAITTADVSNPRRDIVVMYIDYAQTPSTGVSNNTNGVVKIAVVAGTPAGSPSDPSDPTIQSAVGSGNPFIKLARVRVAAGATSITNSVIDDLRTFATPVMGNAGAPGQLVNGQIVRSVSSNNLTVAIKTLAGNDPSATDPVYVRIGNTVRVITAALSVTKNAGTNWFGKGASYFAAAESDYFVYLGWNTTDRAVSIGFASDPGKRLFSEFSATTTAWNYLAYSGSAPASTDEFEVVGRFNAILGASASYNWSLPATAIIINRPIYETRIFTVTNSGDGGGTINFRQRYQDKEVWGFSNSNNAAWKSVQFPVGMFIGAQPPVVTANATETVSPGGWVEVSAYGTAGNKPDNAGFGFLTRTSTGGNSSNVIVFRAIGT